MTPPPSSAPRGTCRHTPKAWLAAGGDLLLRLLGRLLELLVGLDHLRIVAAGGVLAGLEGAARGRFVGGVLLRLGLLVRQGGRVGLRWLRLGEAVVGDEAERHRDRGSNKAGAHGCKFPSVASGRQRGRQPVGSRAGGG